jgi:hypothetical protein
MLTRRGVDGDGTPKLIHIGDRRDVEASWGLINRACREAVDIFRVVDEVITVIVLAISADGEWLIICSKLGVIVTIGTAIIKEVDQTILVIVCSIITLGDTADEPELYGDRLDIEEVGTLYVEIISACREQSRDLLAVYSHGAA